MKVVFAHTDFRIYWPPRLKVLNKFLESRNIRLDVIEIAGSGSPYEFAIKPASLPYWWHCLFPDIRMEDISAKKANKALRSKLNEIQPDVVFAGAIAYPSGAAAILWAIKNRKKIIIFDNARLEDVPRSYPVNYVKRKIYSCIDAVFCPSQAWNKTFNYFGVLSEQIFYGLNVVDNSFWLQAVDNKHHSIHRNYFIAIGRQIQKKNFLFLLKAYQHYVEKVSEPKPLILVGDGPRRVLIEEFIQKNEIETVRLIPFSTHEQLKELFSGAFAFILPSKYGETWGLVVNEAMASGLPVLVSSQAGCASTLVKDGINGFTFSPENAEELTSLLLQMHQLTEEEHREMGQNSKEIIDDWGLNRFCNGVYDAIQFVISKEQRRPDLLSRLLISLWKGRYRPM
jgi:glycosyltransferase involved in cell wall biosynthesis